MTRYAALAALAIGLLPAVIMLVATNLLALPANLDRSVASAVASASAGTDLAAEETLTPSRSAPASPSPSGGAAATVEPLTAGRGPTTGGAVIVAPITQAPPADPAPPTAKPTPPPPPPPPPTPVATPPPTPTQTPDPTRTPRPTRPPTPEPTVTPRPTPTDHQGPDTPPTPTPLPTCCLPFFGCH